MLDASRLTAIITAISFAVGLNLYITVAALGLLARFHWIQLPTGLSLLEHTPVIVVAIALSIVEGVADKIPYVDLVWNAFHTFIRIPAAALLAYHAGSVLSPTDQVLVTVIAAAVASIAHFGKSSARLAVSATPEPFSNAGLSTIEDISAAGLTWFATTHPYWAGGVAIAGMVAILCVMRFLLVGLRRVWAQLRGGMSRV
jgi:hypothetical protein